MKKGEKSCQGMSVADRFGSKVDERDPDECWEWQACKNQLGYGLFYSGKQYDNRMVCAHRMAYTLEHGEIPEGMCVLHDCDNPGCQNPDHLFLGTHDDNMRDREKKGRTPTGLRRRMTHDDVREIRKLRVDGVKIRELAKEFGFGYQSILNVVNYKTWKDIT